MAVSFGSAVIGSSATPALPSPLNEFDLLFAVQSVENNLGATLSAPAAQSGDWAQIGTTQNLDGATFGDITVAFWWARKGAANLGSAGTWQSSAGTPVTSYARVTGGKKTGTPFGAENVGWKITSANLLTNPMPTGPITPTADKTLILCLRALFEWQLTSSTDYANERGDAGAAGPHGIYDDGILTPAGSTGTLNIVPGGSATDGYANLILAVEEEPVPSPPINSPMNLRLYPARQFRRPR